MKVLIVNSLYPPVPGSSGAEKAAASLGEALVRGGHEVVVISLHPERTATTEYRNGVKVYRLPIDNFYWLEPKTRKPVILRWLWHFKDSWNRTAARRVARILDLEKPDVVNTHNLAGFSASVWREVKRRGIRLVHTTHDYYVVCTKRTLFRSNHVCREQCSDCRLLSRRRMKESRKVDALVSVSQETLKLHQQAGSFPGVGSHVVFNIAPPAAPPRPAQARDARAVVFGFIGLLDKKKGIETLLEAVTKLHHDHWRLHIAGRGDEDYSRFLRGLSSDPRINWLGFTPASEFYSSVDVVVIPSLWPEPLPYVCVESLQAEKAIVCSASGGIPEICHMASTLLVVPPGDAASLAEAMDHALQEPDHWRRGGLVNRESLEIFNEQQVINRYLEIYSAR